MQNISLPEYHYCSYGFPKVCVAHCFPLGLRMMCGRAAVTWKHNKCTWSHFARVRSYLCVYFAVPRVPRSQQSQCENAVVREGISQILPLISPKRQKRKPRLVNVVLFHGLLLIPIREDCWKHGEILHPLLTEAQYLVPCRLTLLFLWSFYWSHGDFKPAVVSGPEQTVQL